MNGADYGTAAVVVVLSEAQVTKETSKLRRVTTATKTLIIRKKRTKLSPTEICLNLIRLRDHTQTTAFFIDSVGPSRRVISKKQ